MRWRMHKRAETKPDGRRILYYTFEPADASPDRESPPPPLHPTETDEASLTTDERVHSTHHAPLPMADPTHG